MNGRNIWVIWVLVLFLGGLSGCAFSHRPPAPASHPLPNPVRKTRALASNSEGSLYDEQKAYSSLYADVKARRIGDTVTINIVESASASKNAATKTSRASAVEASWSGVAEKIAGGWVGPDQKVSFNNDFDGKGETTRSSFLNAYITAQVVEVLPNGNMAIWGSRQVQVNNETQYINIQGVIRPADISSSNVVLSTFVADAKIELNGKGVVSDKQRTGWLARILDYVWPF